MVNMQEDELPKLKNFLDKSDGKDVKIYPSGSEVFSKGELKQAYQALNKYLQKRGIKLIFVAGAYLKAGSALAAAGYTILGGAANGLGSLAAGAAVYGTILAAPKIYNNAKNMVKKISGKIKSKSR